MGFRLANVDGRAVLVDDAGYFDIETVSAGRIGPDPMGALHHADELAALSATLSSQKPTGALADVTLGPPVPSPRNSYAVGLNYLAHAAEGNMEVPKAPLVFTKFPSCITGPTADVELRSDGCDYEGELVVVIGKGGKDIAKSDAWNHVVGLTVGQDFSDRPAQFAAKPPHFDLGKSFDTFGPIGPVLVSLDEIDMRAGHPALQIITTVNGEVRQNGSTADMVFDIPTLISYLSRITTLSTGDVIFTGTPDGIGAAQGKFLRDGDVVVTTIEGIGTMTNRCVRVSNYQEEQQ
jgi:2,4-didehydro-3-deoxy-L-rhamnonate hydrolase